MDSHGQPRSQLQYSMYLPSISQSLAMAAPLARSVMSLFEVAEMSLSDITRMSLVGTQEAAPPPSPSQSERAFGGESPTAGAFEGRSTGWFGRSHDPRLLLQASAPAPADTGDDLDPAKAVGLRTRPCRQ